VSYVSARPGGPQSLYTRRGDGTGVEELKVRFDKSIWEAVWSGDGKWLLLRTGGVAGALGGRDVYAMQLGVDSVPRPLLITAADEKAIALSPDNRWLAYESNESGRDEIYVRPFPNVEAGKWQVSINGGTFPLWSHSGREVFYLDNSNDLLTVAQIGSIGGFTVTQRRALFKLDDSYQTSANYTPWEIAPDDRRFLMVRLPSRPPGEPVPLILIENWFEELKQKLRK
jgi:serine/threonine-protein kinase